MADVSTLAEKIQQRFTQHILSSHIALQQLTIEVASENLHAICLALRDEEDFHFNMLMDVCGVDYLQYGVSFWQTEETTFTGFSRGVDVADPLRVTPWDKPRFAAVYHLLSYKHNHRIRIRTFPSGEPPTVDSVIDIWPSANWFEREAFDLFGIVFKNHPDLRRILTDYGFIGHPFRKDFPLIGTVEMRYDATMQRCIYEPVSIQPRTLVPKVVRSDNRYLRINPEGKPNV